jgi:hypothetical protein
MSIDGLFVNGIIWLPFYIYQVSSDSSVYTLSDYILANCNIPCVLAGSATISAALGYGKAGPVMAVENLKTIW